MNSAPGSSVLITCWSNLSRDPRVIRQIEWLSAAGWTVDTLGEGPHPSPAVRDHFEMTGEPLWVRPRAIKALVLLLAPYALRFRILIESRFPRGATERVLAGDYDLVILNDIDFVPWAARVLRKAGRRRSVRAHLDLHEYHTPELPLETSARPLMTGYWSWLRKQISSPVFTTRGTVATGIASLYASEFGIEPPRVVRNSPAFVDQVPSAVDPSRIELLYHGNAAWERGLAPLVESVPLLDERFTLTLMLTGDPAVVRELTERAGKSRGRIRVIPPVAMEDVSTAINGFDLEVMLYPPATPNLRFALPNKLFEAVQGRLGLVVGDSPSMVELVEEYGNGVIVAGWTSRDLADALNALTAADIERMKAGSARCAEEVNSEKEEARFMASIGQAVPGA